MKIMIRLNAANAIRLGRENGPFTSDSTDPDDMPYVKVTFDLPQEMVTDEFRDRYGEYFDLLCVDKPGASISTTWFLVTLPVVNKMRDLTPEALMEALEQVHKKDILNDPAVLMDMLREQRAHEQLCNCRRAKSSWKSRFLTWWATF